MHDYPWLYTSISKDCSFELTVLHKFCHTRKKIYFLVCDKGGFVTVVSKYKNSIGDSASGEIDAGILVNLSEDSVKELLSFLKNKEFTNVRRWIVNNLDNDPSRIYRRIYDSLYDNLDGRTIPNAVLVLADYSYKSAFVADQEINLLACMTELMQNCQFK
jgi:hypothetical protein